MNLLQFTQFITESIENELLGHLSHVRDLPHEIPGKGGDYAIDVLKKYHANRMGKKSDITPSKKIDGGASVIIRHNQDGTVEVSDKHRFDRGVTAKNEQEIDKHFGHAPGYAASLKSVMRHAHKVVPRGKTLQGDLLFDEHSKPEHKNNQTHFTPNRITYSIPRSKAKVGIAFHTEIKNGRAHGIDANDVKKHPDVFVPEVEHDVPTSKYSESARKRTEAHIRKAEEIHAQSKDHSHLTDQHKTHLPVYLNKTIRTKEKPSIEGYKQHLKQVGEKEASKVKTAEAQERKRSAYEKLASHVDEHSKKFQSTFDLRHHLQKATDSALSGISHDDMKTSVDSKPSKGEGVVLRKDNRPVAKLVPSEISHHLLTNTRFQK